MPAAEMEPSRASAMIAEVAARLVLEELNAGIRVQEAGHPDQIDVVGLGQTRPQLIGRPAGAGDAVRQATVGDGAVADEGVEGGLIRGPDGTTAVPAHRQVVVDSRRNRQTGEGESRTGAKAGRETCQHGSEKNSSNKT